MSSPSQHSDVVILGAGIGGFEAFRELSKLFKHHGIHKTITIVDQNDYFTFTPLLHEVATGSVLPSHATVPLRELTYKTPHRFLKASATALNPKTKTITTSEGTITYDYCIMAIGSGLNFFGVPGADTYAETVRTLTQAMRFRERIIKHLEKQPKKLALTVVGGGYTGVEVVGQLAFLREHALKKLFPTTTITLTVIESSPAVASVLPPKAQQKILRRLQRLHVIVRTGTAVKEVREKEVVLGTGEVLPSDITFWCTGIGNTANTLLPEAFCEKGRVRVNDFLQHTTEPSLYAVGDVALAQAPGAERPYPQLGEVAHHQGLYVARHITASIRQTRLKPFLLKSTGTLMPVGDRYAVAVIYGFVFEGLFAWWLRRTVYLLFMPGILRKITLVLQWTLHLFGFGYIIALEKK
jgi:NADH dehydrogenase